MVATGLVSEPVGKAGVRGRGTWLVTGPGLLWGLSEELGLEVLTDHGWGCGTLCRGITGGFWGRDPSQGMPGVWGLAFRKEGDVKISGKRGHGPESRA